MPSTRRQFIGRLAAIAGSAALPPSIARALAIPADRRTGTIEDVDHIVLLMMENRSFDHYFGAMNGVRGFADRFPIPVADGAGLHGQTVWSQRNERAAIDEPHVLSPQHNDTALDFALLRSVSTPHLYPNAQEAWDHGRMGHWPQWKTAASMVYFQAADLPFQYALADAFTLCDANHCSMTGGTNPNRCFFFTGTNHGRDAEGPGVFNGPAVDNTYNTLRHGPVRSGYTWTSYPERLEEAGIAWQIYQDQEHEFFALNPLLGFRAWREANAASVPQVSPSRTPLQQALYEKGIRTRDLAALRDDVVAGRLPQVSWICPTASGSEHPADSSPAQGAAYIAQVLDALTANPAVWARTALIVNFDENDGLFDHVPPPAPPSYVDWNADPGKAVRAGDSTVDTGGEYLGEDDGGVATVDAYRHRPWGLGPRVPMFVVSPWSQGGWVDSQVFDQTSTIRFVEARFGVREPNISAWRRAVTGDLTSCFDFSRRAGAAPAHALPDTATRDAASRALGGTVRPRPAVVPMLPVQQEGARPSRPLPYVLHAEIDGGAVPAGANQIGLRFRNEGAAGAVFHVYDRLHLERMPRRYTVEAAKRLTGLWDGADNGGYDLWVLGPNGFHRHLTGRIGSDASSISVTVAYDTRPAALRLSLHHAAGPARDVELTTNAYGAGAPMQRRLEPGQLTVVAWPLVASGGWYDLTLASPGDPAWSIRMAGRIETGAASVTDPAMHGTAIGAQVARRV